MFGDPTLREPLIALGMTAFLAAVTQAPLTAFIIVMEMVDGGAMVMSLMAAAMLSSLIARQIGKPLYPALATFMLANIYAQTQPQPEQKADTAREEGAASTSV